MRLAIRPFGSWELGVGNYLNRRPLATALVLMVLGAACGSPQPPLIVLATTTSVANSGLLDQLVPVFESAARVRVRAVPVGSGRALAMLDGRQADVAITHAPAQEAEALKKHPGWSYRKMLY